MAVPKRRQSNQKSRSRRAHHAKTPPHLLYCPQCSEPVPAHVICPKCGYYMGRNVVDMTAATEEKKKKK